MMDSLNKTLLVDGEVSVARHVRKIEDLELQVNQLMLENNRLEKLLQTRKQFIRLVTHELKAPIAAVENYLKLILRGYIDLADQDKILEKCIVRTCEERQLIDDLLDLGRMEVMDSLPTVPVYLDQVLENVLLECQEDVVEKKINLCLDIKQNIPAILAVPELIRSVWCNLISNALKYTPNDGDILIHLQARDRVLDGRVQDSGIGISEQDQKKIFQEFFRGENARNTSVAGTGLGLVLVKRIVESLGGMICVASRLGEGSMFQFTIPLDSGKPG